jgi:hypothetical protein
VEEAIEPGRLANVRIVVATSRTRLKSRSNVKITTTDDGPTSGMVIEDPICSCSLQLE